MQGGPRVTTPRPTSPPKATGCRLQAAGRRPRPNEARQLTTPAVSLAQKRGAPAGAERPRSPAPSPRARPHSESGSGGSSGVRDSSHAARRCTMLPAPCAPLSAISMPMVACSLSRRELTRSRSLRVSCRSVCTSCASSPGGCHVGRHTAPPTRWSSSASPHARSMATAHGSAWPQKARRGKGGPSPNAQLSTSSSSARACSVERRRSSVWQQAGNSLEARGSMGSLSHLRHLPRGDLLASGGHG